MHICIKNIYLIVTYNFYKTINICIDDEISSKAVKKIDTFHVIQSFIKSVGVVLR